MAWMSYGCAVEFEFETGLVLVLVLVRARVLVLAPEPVLAHACVPPHVSCEFDPAVLYRCELHPFCSASLAAWCEFVVCSTRRCVAKLPYLGLIQDN